LSAGDYEIALWKFSYQQDEAFRIGIDTVLERRKHVLVESRGALLLLTPSGTKVNSHYCGSIARFGAHFLHCNIDVFLGPSPSNRVFDATFESQEKGAGMALGDVDTDDWHSIPPEGDEQAANSPVDLRTPAKRQPEMRPSE
jgi:hypothetical protein